MMQWQDPAPGGPARDISLSRRQPGGPRGDSGDSLADVLERVLDKGVVIAGDITIAIAQIELLQIKVRLLIASIDKAQEMGINWWQSDPALSVKTQQLETENRLLRERLEHIESRLALAAPEQAAEAPAQAAPAAPQRGRRSTTASRKPRKS